MMTQDPMADKPPSGPEDGRDNAQPLSEIIREKEFLGAEFLTWLWFKSETQGGLFRINGVGEVGIHFVKLIQLESGSKDTRERVNCMGKMARMTEARIGLSTGKKVTRARFIIETEGVSVEATLNARTLDVQSLKIMRGFDDSLESDVLTQGKRGAIFYKLSLIRRVSQVVHGIFLEYMCTRVDRGAWELERRGLRKWILEHGIRDLSL